MIRKSRTMPTVALACLLAALAGCGSAPGDDRREAERLMQTSRDWAKVASSGDVDAVVNYFAEDAVLISSDQAPVRGRAALRAHLGQTLKLPGFRISWEPLEAHVSGDMGYMLERTTLTMTGPQGAPVTQQLQAVTVWRKQADGSWKNVVDMSAPAAPAAPRPV